jgi:hypothetical protein
VKDMNIFETLKKLNDNQRKQPSYIFLDETDGKIKEMPLKKLDSSASALINRTVRNPTKIIHDLMFGT